MTISVLLVPFRPTAAELLKHKFFTKAKVGFTWSLSKTFCHYPFLYWWDNLTISRSSRTMSICRRSSSWKARQYQTDPGRLVLRNKTCWNSPLESLKGTQWESVSQRVGFELWMLDVGAACARLQRSPPQDGGRRLGVERRRAGRGERGGQGRCAGSAGETPRVRRSDHIAYRSQQVAMLLR